MNVDRPGLDDIKTFPRVAFVKKVVAFGEMFRNHEGGNRGNIRRWEAGKKLAGAECILDNCLPEFPGFDGHQAEANSPGRGRPAKN